ncbi:MAG: prepilin-type N-terminal cleavage/methylation domain-containing protein, partial [Oscillospiraceae bacterium]|nr:prepilin-type N-terminal cleavage/methylation domain-containing protein [Oscillospiraceae bacterium]
MRGRPAAGRKHIWKSRVGFTMMEVIAVLAIVSILAAVAGPAMRGFIEHGRQNNRENIARTLYLAAQNQLTKRVSEKSLSSTLTKDYYLDNGELRDDLLALPSNVYKQLDDNDGSFPDEDEENKPYVHYISKPANYTPDGSGSEIDSFYWLLNDIIVDKEVLDNAILMEYNIVTGVVLSMFYSDILGDGGEFGYYEETVNQENNVTGGRGAENGYQYAYSRKQGYYGVESTGELPPPPKDMEVVNIYDGADKPLTGFGENVLYAELFVPDYAEIEYTVELTGTGIIMTVDLDDDDTFSDYFYPDGSEYIVQYGIEIELNKYIWVLDYIDGGDYYSTITSLPEPVDGARVKMTSKDAVLGVTSSTYANTHYYKDNMSGGRYQIKTARHLYNVRSARDKDFTQTADIDMGGITAFTPIDNFSGNYFADNHVIDNLKVSLFAKIDGGTIRSLSVVVGDGGISGAIAAEMTGGEIRLSNAVVTSATDTSMGGLVGKMTGGTIRQSYSNATITSIAGIAGNTGGLVGKMTGGTITQSYSRLSAIKVTGTGNTGGLVGALGGDGVVERSYSYANVTSGGGNTGGLIGHLADGATLERSFNAGFYDATVDTLNGVGSVMAEGGNIGGLVGLNEGAILNCFNNARVNVEDVEVTNNLSHSPTSFGITSDSYLGGIAGENSGTIQNVYATNFVGIYAGFEGRSGGIAGENSGTVTNSYYLDNGCNSGSGEAKTKDEMSGLSGI